MRKRKKAVVEYAQSYFRLSIKPLNFDCTVNELKPRSLKGPNFRFKAGKQITAYDLSSSVQTTLLGPLKSV